jgi:hypothetical protein
MRALAASLCLSLDDAVRVTHDDATIRLRFLGLP